MQHIITKGHGPTRTKPARVSATSTSGKRVFVPADLDADDLAILGARDTHDAAVVQLCRLLEWNHTRAQVFVRGGFKDGSFIYLLTGQEPYLTVNAKDTPDYPALVHMEAVSGSTTEYRTVRANGQEWVRGSYVAAQDGGLSIAIQDSLSDGRPYTVNLDGGREVVEVHARQVKRSKGTTTKAKRSS